MSGHPGTVGSTKEHIATIYKQIREAQTLDANGDEMVSLGGELVCSHISYSCFSVDRQAPITMHGLT